MVFIRTFAILQSHTPRNTLKKMVIFVILRKKVHLSQSWYVFMIFIILNLHSFMSSYWKTQNFTWLIWFLRKEMRLSSVVVELRWGIPRLLGLEVGYLLRKRLRCNQTRCIVKRNVISGFSDCGLDVGHIRCHWTSINLYSIFLNPNLLICVNWIEYLGFRE